MTTEAENFLDLNQYKVEKLIGQGTFGKVLRVKDIYSKKPYAAKVSLKETAEYNPSSENQGNVIFLYREIKIMSALDHPSIIKCIGYSPLNFEGEHKMTIITEYYPKGSLQGFINREKANDSPPEWNDTKKLTAIYGIASGMAYLHKHDIIHRDLKPENILMDLDLYPKITDFGLSKITNTVNESLNMQSAIGNPKGTPLFMAPETIENEYLKKSDVYSFSMIVYMLMTGLQPFLGVKNHYQIFFKVMKCERPFIPENLSEPYKNLIEKCWSQSPDDRPSFEEIIELLKTDNRFITDKMDEEEFHKYVDLIDNYEASFDLLRGNLSLGTFTSSSEKFILEENKLTFPPELFEKLNEDSKSLVKDSEKDPLKKFAVGKNLIEGKEGFKKDSHLGLAYLKESMFEGCDESIIYLCKLLIEGKVTKSDPEKARQLIEKVKNKQSTEYQFILGRIEHKEKNYRKAMEYYQSASERGHAESMYKYGKMLIKGQGMTKNAFRAKEYFQKATQNGCPKKYKPKFTDKNVIYSLKICFVGDFESGKHELVYYSVNDKLSEYIPTNIENNKMLYNYHGECIKLNFVDTYGQEDYKQVRNTMYEKTNIFVFVFSLIEKSTLKSIVDKWNDDIKDYRENAYVMLIGLDLDKWTDNPPNRVTQNEIDEAEQITKAKVVIKCSLSDGENITNFKNKLIEFYFHNFYQVQLNENNNRSRRASRKDIDFKVLFVGCKDSGQFELLQYIDKGFISRDKMMSSINKFDKQVNFHGRKVNLHFFGTPGDEEHQKIRELAYPQTDVIVLVFSLIYKDSFHSLFRTYLREIEKIAPNAALVLVGVDVDKWEQFKLEFGLDINFVKDSELAIFANTGQFQQTVLCSYNNGKNLDDFCDQIINAYIAKNGDANACIIA